jgi:hypothetical protein
MVLFAFSVVLLVSGILAARPRILPAADEAEAAQPEGNG